MKLTDILKQIIQEKKAKRDRCLRIADRKFNKPSAYKSGAVVRCRQGKIWKGLKEEENPPNIEYIKPNFEYEWEEAIRYPEFKKMGFDNWVKTAQKGYEVNFSDIKDKLKNVDLNFDSLNQDKKIRFINAFKTNQIELPIAVKFSENDYDLVGGNTRLSGLVRKGIDPKIWIVDLTTLKEDNQPSEGSYQQALKDIKPIIPVLSHNLIHQQSLEHNEENMVKLNQKIFDLVKKGDGTILDRLWDLAGNSLLKNAINIITFYHKSNLNESKQVGPLYHFTDFFSLKKILTSNTMIGSYGNQDIKGRYISTTRDKNFYKSDPNLGVENLQAALIFDGNKLSNKYKIKPYAYEPYRDLDRSGAEAEELIILPGRDLPNIKSYLSGVILLKPNKAIESFLKKENIPYNVDLSEAKKETLRTWFKRKGAPGKTGGWVDCNSPIRKDGKITGYKPCGRQKGEERAKYPSCRPTAARCKDKGKGTKWGKTK